jgi:very-short-patch-repair endonuclease
VEGISSLERLIEPPLAKGAANKVSGGFVQPYNKTLKQFSRTLRSNMTEAEQHLWFRLRNKQLGGIQFYRQKPLLSFIVDFYCPKAKLVIELDGSQHFEAKHQIKDAERDATLTSIGLKVLRFDDGQVLRETDAVIAVIYAEVVERLKSSNLP